MARLLVDQELDMRTECWSYPGKDTTSDLGSQLVVALGHLAVAIET